MRLRPVEGIPEIEADDAIGPLLERLDPPDEDTVVVVSSTIVSKAENRGRRLAGYDPGERAVKVADRLQARSGDPKDPRFAQAVLDESEELLIDDPFLLAVTRFGHVGVNAGIDRTNLPSDADILLLPEAPNESAKRIRAGLERQPPVIVADTSGRPFRLGQRGVAIGWAGMPATDDWRGQTDRRGRPLSVTVEAVVDELAAAANVIAGEADGGRPVVYVEGMEVDDLEGGDRLFRPPETDYVRRALRDWQLEPP